MSSPKFAINPNETRYAEAGMTGHLLLDHPLLNEGSAFTEDERRRRRLLGLLTYHSSTVDEQSAKRILPQRKARGMRREGRGRISNWILLLPSFHEQSFPRVEEKATNFASREGKLAMRRALCFIS